MIPRQRELQLSGFIGTNTAHGGPRPQGRQGATELHAERMLKETIHALAPCRAGNRAHKPLSLDLAASKRERLTQPAFRRTPVHWTG